MKNTFFYRIDGQGNPINGTLARLPRKPITGQWEELTNICCTDPGCPPTPDPVPVLFSCMEGNFYLEVADEGTDFLNIVGFWTMDGDAEFSAQIPRGTFDLRFSSLAPDSDLLFNGVVVGTADGSGNLVLLAYDTTDIETISNCVA